MSDRRITETIAGVFRADDYGRTELEIAVRLVAALKAARIALIELPEPDDKPYQPTWSNATGLAKWDTPEFGPLSVWDDGSILFDTEVLNAAYARSIGSALLAAAEKADTHA